jgi:hypothetical protein
MGFIADTVQNLVGGLTGSTAANAATDSAAIQAQAGQAAIDEQRRASEQGLGFLSPYGAIGQQGLDQAGFLANPQAQFDFLQNNPLFQLGLNNLNDQTQFSAAAGGRLNAGDTLSQLNNNAMLAGAPLIDRQRQDIMNLLGIGTNIAQSQANTALGTGTNVSNLLTDVGAAQAGGVVGAANSQQQGIGNILGLGGLLLSGGIFGGGSAPRLR